MKTCSNSLMGKGKLNSMKYCFIFIRLRGKKVRVSKFGEAIGETEILFFFFWWRWEFNCTATLKMNLTVSNKVENAHPLQPQSSTAGNGRLGNSYMCVQGNMLRIFIAAPVIAKSGSNLTVYQWDSNNVILFRIFN